MIPRSPRRIFGSRWTRRLAASVLVPVALVVARVALGESSETSGPDPAAGASPHPPGSVPAAPTAPARASDLWSLRPLARAGLPPVSRDGSAHLVDRFLDARMAAAGLEPSPEAPREVVLRRLSFVLRGLPPSPGEIEAYAADASVDAWDRVVDRMLGSPRFGERWARHWMDVVRYSDSHGSQGDPELPMAWRYRDYLIRAFNQDVPYHQFVREHVAGDLLPDPRIDPVLRLNESALGTAHFRMVELGYIPVDALDDRIKAVDNQIDVLSKAFLGLTVSCARCHDHKFDPISQRDFHAWYSILASGRPGQIVVDDPSSGTEALRRIAMSKERIRAGLASAWRPAVSGLAGRWLGRAHREVAIEALESDLRAAREERRRLEAGPLAAWRGSRRSGPAAGPSADLPVPLARWTFEADAADEVGGMHGRVVAGAAVRDGRLRLPGGDAHLVTAPLPADLTAMTLEAWVALDTLDQRGGGVVTVQTPDSEVFDAIVFGEQTPGRWMAGSDFFRRTRDVGGPVETRRSEGWIHVAITHGADGTITVYRDGMPYGTAYRPGPAHRYRAGIDRVVLGRRHLGHGVAGLAGEVEEARVYDRALGAAEVAASFRAGFETLPLARLREFLGPIERARHDGVRAKIDRLEARLAREREAMTTGAPWGNALEAAERDETHALHPWARLRHLPARELSRGWEAMVAARLADQAAREASNRLGFTPAWDLRGPGAAGWVAGGAGRPAEPRPAGDFVVEPSGDRILDGLLPAGVLSSTLSRKQPGVLLSPRFRITTDSVSLRALGSHANARVVIEDYPIGNGGIYPARGLDRETAGWMRWDTAYRKGSLAHIEVVTSEDFASPGFRSGSRPYSDGRAGFAVAEVVFHDGPQAPRDTVWPWRGLAGATPPRTLDDLAVNFARHARRCLDRWERREADDDEVAFLDALVRAGELPSTLSGLPRLAGEVAGLRRQEASLSVPRRAPGLHEVVGDDFPLFQRGEPSRPGPIVRRGRLSALGGGDYDTRGSGRLELARDLSNPTRPLVARVIVNRVWHHVFGRGLVATPDNLGRLGVPPTHPELLDALARWFLDDGGSVRRLVRLLVTSQAFARSAIPGPAVAAKDPANDLGSHARIRRLDAESVRDALLAVSGELDLRMGGPGVAVYYTGKSEGGGTPGPLDGDRRRTVYQRARRNAHHPLLEAFDAPRPATPRGARDVTNVPAQSLAMLNDPLVREMAVRWARRLVAEGAPRAERIRGMLVSALGRPPDAAEVAAFSAHLSDLARDHGVQGDGGIDAEVAVWADLAQSLFCLKEFVHVH